MFGWLSTGVPSVADRAGAIRRLVPSPASLAVNLLVAGLLVLAAGCGKTHCVERAAAPSRRS